MYVDSGLNGLVTEINNCRDDVCAEITLMLMTKISHILGENHD
jgi:hypothetical protein